LTHFPVDRSSRRINCLEFAQSGIQIKIEILLSLLGSIQLVIERFNLPPQAGDFFNLALDLAGQIQLCLGLLVESRLSLDPEISNLATGFFVIKNTGVSLNGP
jgi:hypothetical protein